MVKEVCIYKITSPSGKIYIGQTRNLYLRKIMYKKLHCYKQRKLFASITKYTWEAHTLEVIEYCSIDMLNIKEKYWIKFYDSSNIGMNLTSGGDSYTRSEETNIKISESKKGSNNPMFGKCGELHHRYGKQASKETIAKLVQSHLGKGLGEKNGWFKGYVTAYKDGVFIGRYEGVKATAKALNICSTNISKVILGKRKQASGYTFKRDTV